MNEYFSHDYRARADKKLVQLAMVHGMEGIGVFWCIVEMLYEESGYVLQNEYERIAYELRVKPDLVKSVVEDFQLFAVKNDRFFSRTVLNRLKKRNERSEKARQSVAVRWQRKSLSDGNTNVLQGNYDASTIKVYNNKEKDRKEKESVPPISPPGDSSDTPSSDFIKEEGIPEKKEKSCGKKERNFIPPTLCMIREYCKSRNNNVDAQKFFDHYTAVGWRVGKAKMCDWQAAVRTWENSTNSTNTTKTYGNT